MNVLIVDGHPDVGGGERVRLLTALLDHYARSLPAQTSIERINIRDLAFSPNLQRGYRDGQAWEPDLERSAQAVAHCDHLVIGFPLWWGAEPAMLKGWIERVLLPGFAFRYHPNDQFWDGLLAGRSADLIITMDTPPWYLRLVYGDSVTRRWRGQMLGFCGVKPIRVFRLGPTRRGAAAKKLGRWEAALAKAAQTAGALGRGKKSIAPLDRGAIAEGLKGGTS
jgi:NAD(P)H dehydrogenase (quinone)